MLKKVNIGFFFPLAAVALLVLLLSNQMFSISPLGRLLDPFKGVANNGTDDRLDAKQVILSKTGLTDSVQVFFDERKVPHIFAANTTDLYFAQGYITASLRLWQMDFTSYVGGGRLSELLAGPEFLELDRNQRRIGVVEAAKSSLRLIEQHPETIAVLNAYTAGVNAYIKELNYSSMPLEYKLLDYKPEPWTNLKTLLIQKNVAVNMTGYGEDLLMSRMLLALGEEKFNQLFPEFYPYSSPVVNTGATTSTAFSQLKQPAYLDFSFLSSTAVLPKESYNPRLGSNSWAVSGKKTRSGFPILASDPHLNLTLPCIWLEMQLAAPGTNAYGVSIPGTPALIIGFNENIAWGITNGSDDVKDWYKLKISPDYKQYEMDGKWLNLEARVDTFYRKGQKMFLDTVYSTVHGPIVTNSKNFPGQDADIQNNAQRWEMQRASNEFITFIKLNRARNYAEYTDAIRTYTCPLQNFTFACKDNTIAINHQGNLQVKWAGQGKFILDGTRSDHLATRYIPFDSLPHQLNPAGNFVFSANQQPTTAAYPYYYHGYYAEPRANHIKALLEKDSAFDIAAMQAIQLDNTNYIALAATPVLVARTNSGLLKEEQRKLLTAMAGWKGTYNAGDEYARLFEAWWRNITLGTWDEFGSYKFYTQSPKDNVLLNLVINDSASTWFDRLGTTQKETAADIITDAFIKVADEYIALKQAGTATSWGSVNKVDIVHMTNMPAFSRLGISSAGHPDAVNALSGNWGPSWRMVVELGDRPKGFGIYPGGQSGNPGSRYYDNFINDWNQGKYYPLHFYTNKDEARAAGGTSWLINK